MRSIGRFSAAALLALGLAHHQLTAAPATPRDLQRAASECQEGTKLLMSGDVARAKDRFGKALGLVATYPDAHLGMGHVAMREGRYEDALKEYQQARDGYQELGESILDLQAKRYTETQRTIATLRDNLRNMTSQNAQENARVQPTQLEREVAATEDQIRRLEAVQMPSRDNPTEPPGEIYFHMGNAQFRLDRNDDAIASWETCAAKSPKFGMVHNNLAVVYWKKGRFDDARGAIAHAKQLGFPVNPQFQADLEKAAAASGATASAAAPPPAAAPPAAAAPAEPAAQKP